MPWDSGVKSRTFFLIGCALFLCGCFEPEALIMEITSGRENCSGPGAFAGEDGLWQQIIDRYVQKDGRIDYQKLAQDPNDRTNLDCIIQEIAGTTFTDDAYPQDSYRAFYINAYNACVLRGTLEFYPLQRLRQCPVDFPAGLRFTVAGEVLTLDELARRCGQTNDWRVKFALTGATLTSPVIAPKIYQAETLESQLEVAVQRYLGGCAGLQIDYARRRILVGELIWQQREFLRRHYQQKYGISVSLLSALIPWATEKTQAILADLPGYKVDKLEPDDHLNDIEHNEETSQTEEIFLPCGCI